MGVHPDVADPEPARERIARSRSVVERAAEAERVVIGDGERLGLIVERQHRQDRPKIPALAIDMSAWTSSKIVGAM